MITIIKEDTKHCNACNSTIENEKNFYYINFCTTINNNSSTKISLCEKCLNDLHIKCLLAAQETLFNNMVQNENQKETVSNNSELKQILEDIKNFVIVTGSYAEGTQTISSDIDFYIKSKNEGEIDLEANYVEDTYCMQLIRYFEKRGYSIGSVYVDSFHIDDTSIPLEFSHYYKIDENNTFEIDIAGVKMAASVSLFKK